MPTGTAILTDALKCLGVAPAGETPTSGEIDDALVQANRMIDAWGADRLTMHAIVRTTKALTSGTQDYTIGSGGSINIVRPDYIDAAGILIDNTASPTTENPIEVFTLQRWEAIRIKANPGSPATGIYYDKAMTAGLGTISVYPKPNSSTTTLVLYCPTAITAIALATTYTWPPGYEAALQWNVAKMLIAQFPVSQQRIALIMQMADESLKTIKRPNQTPKELIPEPAVTQGSSRRQWNINTDSVNYP